MLGDSLKRRRGSGPSGSDRPREREPLRWRLTGPLSWQRWLVLALVILLTGFGAGYVLATQVFFPRPDTAGRGIPAPDLYGETFAQAEAILRTLELGVGDITSMKSTAMAAGRILAQDPVPGQQLMPGAEIAVGVSAGPPELRVPPLVGLGSGTARELLESLGFEVAVQQTRSLELPAGVVTRTEPAAGTLQSLPAEVTMIVSTGPPPVEVPDSLTMPEGLVPAPVPDTTAGGGG